MNSNIIVLPQGLVWPIESTSHPGTNEVIKSWQKWCPYWRIYSKIMKIHFISAQCRSKVLHIYLMNSLWSPWRSVAKFCSLLQGGHKKFWFKCALLLVLLCIWLCCNWCWWFKLRLWWTDVGPILVTWFSVEVEWCCTARPLAYNGTVSTVVASILIWKEMFLC